MCTCSLSLSKKNLGKEKRHYQKKKKDITQVNNKEARELQTRITAQKKTEHDRGCLVAKAM